MVLARGKFWRASMTSKGNVGLEILKVSLPEELYEVRDLKISVPLVKWNRLVKNVYSDRKLLGGLLLDFAQHKDRVSTAVASDRLLAELRRVILDATACMVEEGVLELAPTRAAGGME